MPDNDAHADMTHAQHRLGVPAAERGYGPQPGLHEQIAAGQLTAHATSGDLGAARQLVHELEHGISPWTVDPWRLLDVIAAGLAAGLTVGERTAPWV
jgi:hypothetical protein